MLTSGLIRERYTVERELGRGGMAVVYLARDTKHSRPVAIKVLRPEIAVGLGTDRFLREIQIEATLQHPHIVGLIDSGTTDEPLQRPYYVMPYIEGETLRQRLTREGQVAVAARRSSCWGRSRSPNRALLVRTADGTLASERQLEERLEAADPGAVDRIFAL